jgi:nicotinate-nucleotide adenylyltransferase
MKIGILGGAFDPVHLGHLELAQKALVQFSLDKIIFIPAFHPPHKQHSDLSSSVTERCEMVRLAIEGNLSFEMSDCEIVRKGVSYSFDTVCELERRYPGAIFYLILGEDAFMGIPTWHRADELKKKVRFLVARRPDHALCGSPDVSADWIEMPPCPSASSAIREAVRQGRNVEEHLPPKVMQFIRAHALYRKA